MGQEKLRLFSRRVMFGILTKIIRDKEEAKSECPPFKAEGLLAEILLLEALQRRAIKIDYADLYGYLTEMQDIISELKMETGLTEAEEKKYRKQLYKEKGSFSKRTVVEVEVQWMSY